MSRALVLTLAAATLACSVWRRTPPPAPPAPALPPAPATRRLVVADVPLHFTPITRPGAGPRSVALGLSLRLGHASDPPDRPGLSALLLGLLRGHDEREGSLAAALADLGGAPQLHISSSGALLATEVPAEHAPAALRALLAAIRRPLDQPGDAAELAAELADITAELAAARARARDDPTTLALAGLRRVSLPPGHPHATSELSSGTWSLEQVREHGQRSLGPAALTIVVAGDADPQALVAAAAPRLAGWSGPADPQGLPALAPAPRRAIHRIARPGLAQAVVVLGRAAAIADDDLATQVAADIVQSALGERLRDDMAATYGVEVSREPARGPGLLRIVTQVDAAAVGRSLGVIADTLARLRRQGLAPGLVARVCVHEALEQLYRRQTDADQLQSLARAHWHALPNARPPPCDAAAVTRSLRSHFALDDLQIVVVGDPSLVDAPLADLDLGPIVDLPAASL